MSFMIFWKKLSREYRCAAAFCNPDFFAFPRVTDARVRGKRHSMKKLLLTCMSVFSLGALALHAEDKKSADEVAVIKTSEGTMVLGFWTDVAPGTVENFKKLARQGFYDGTAFHRIIKGFMIQGGDPLSKDPSKEDRFGTGDPGYKIKAEFNDKHHERGVISMARAADPDSAGSQFFICDGDCAMLDHKYTGFGKLIKGDDVLEKIASTPVTMSRSGEPSKPEKTVKVESIKIVPASSVK
jgi:peptidyl-prolyl cis-trans isomerase B (cyclophilin B)